MRKNLLLVLFSLSVSFSYSQIKLPHVFADDMILQQQAEVAIWGKGKPSAKIEVFSSWNGQKYATTVASDSTWLVKIKTDKASYNAYSITIRSGKESKELKNILLGEVWFCGGQSNMEQPLKGNLNQPIMGSTADIASSSNPYFRCYKVKRCKSATLLDDQEGEWTIASPNTSANFTATGFYFGRLIQQILNVPVGLLHCSYGGSTVQAWMSDDALDKHPAIDRTTGDLKDKDAHLRASVLYKGMLNSIIGYGIKGCIWYQGESNLEDYKSYPGWFAEMHNDWIEKWGQGEFPIYFCQIAPFNYKGGTENKAAIFRETQLKIAENQRNTGIAILLDAGEKDCIHPANKKAAGERLAYVAMGKSYGFDKFPYKSPSYKSMEVKDEGKILVRFSDAPVGLMLKSEELLDFELAGEDKVFHPAKAKIIKEGVEVSSDMVGSPVAVRYAFKNYIHGMLYGANELPVSSFRSDNWE